MREQTRQPAPLPRRIVIVGGGTSGWMAAAAFSRFLGEGWYVRLIESEDIGTVGVGEATIPQIQHFNAGLGIDEADFVRATQGSFKLGIVFADWLRPGHRYIHAFGGIGRPLGLIAFHHYWLRHCVQDGADDLWAFSATAQAAAQNRFGPAPAIAHAYHFDASLYAAYLRRYAEARGVERIEGKVVDVTQDSASGDIVSVTLDGGLSVEGDIFVDCSGFRGLLIEGALNSGYEDWRHWLPCDRALAVPCESVSPITPYTQSTARAAGWQWRIPLQHRIGNGHVYCSDHMSDDEAARILLDNLDGPALADPRPLRFVTGKRRQIWKNNCVSLGLASGFLEPLESTSIHLIQAGIARFLQYLPGETVDTADRDAFNAQMDFEFASIRDFIILHYHATEREGPMWQHCREMALPDSLAQKIALFRANGRIARFNEELFTETGWLQVLWGQGIRPRGWHPLADALSEADLAEFMMLAKAQASQQAAALPTHEAYIAAHCAAPIPQRIPA
ncbi:tryptophan halogenase family protein [Sphingobium algorifonticola]|uniref:Tryptophan 7-halogenase n=1 Tax=Sphingobium algorifonticola TaxID=2008318 RepID=A0A437J8T7_9SPHN|nr:tryptophan halogenase family protein [Sphingobium algorifonticola]RVT41906.1 tryptophan 7-halogenase [Sphingobium algorifonticola]